MTTKWQRRAARRDKKRRERRYGHRRDGDSVKLIQRLKRNRFIEICKLRDDDQIES